MEISQGLEHIWKSRATRWVLPGCFLLAAFWGLIGRPSPGIAVAILGAAAAVMSLRGEIHIFEKAGWVAIIFALIAAEVLAIKRSDDESARQRAEQATKLWTLNLQAADIQSGLKQSVDQSQKQFEATMQSTNSILGTTRDVATLAKENLESLTGGDSVAYLAPQPPTEDGNVPLAIVNPGKFPLTGVTVVVRDVTTYPFKDSPVISVGTLASHLVRPLDVQLKPLPGTNPPGVASFSISIYAQNGTSEQLLQFRRGKKMLWDHRATILRSAPAPRTMIPKTSIPTSDMPGFKFSYGWIEDRPNGAQPQK